MTRIQQARRKVQTARTAIAIASVAGFALFAGLARASHPATHRATSSAATTSAAQPDDSYSFLGPSGSATPQIQSGAS